MDFSQLIFGAFSGDLGALSVLFVLLLPFGILYALARWIIDR